MKKSDLVSIIMPVYNSELYLEKSLDSLIKQSYNDIEIIIIDDESKDNSLEIIKRYSDLDNRIFFKKQKNSGPGTARNNAMKLAKGNYIFFLDSDDYLKKDCIEEMVKNIKKYESDLVVFEGRGFYYKNNKFIFDKYKYFNIPNEYLYVPMNNIDASKFAMEYISPCLKLYDKSFLEKNNIKFSEGIFGEDVEFWYNCILKLEKIVFVDYIGYLRRYTPNSIMQTYSKKQLFERISTIEKIKNDIENSQLKKENLIFIKENLALYAEALLIKSLKYDLNDRNELLNSFHEREGYYVLKQYSKSITKKLYRKLLYKNPTLMNKLWSIKKYVRKEK